MRQSPGAMAAGGGSAAHSACAPPLLRPPSRTRLSCRPRAPPNLCNCTRKGVGVGAFSVRGCVFLRHETRPQARPPQSKTTPSQGASTGCPVVRRLVAWACGQHQELVFHCWARRVREAAHAAAGARWLATARVAWHPCVRRRPPAPASCAGGRVGLEGGTGTARVPARHGPSLRGRLRSLLPPGRACVPAGACGSRPARWGPGHSGASACRYDGPVPPPAAVLTRCAACLPGWRRMARSARWCATTAPAWSRCGPGCAQAVRATGHEKERAFGGPASSARAVHSPARPPPRARIPRLARSPAASPPRRLASPATTRRVPCSPALWAGPATRASWSAWARRRVGGGTGGRARSRPAGSLGLRAVRGGAQAALGCNCHWPGTFPRRCAPRCPPPDACAAVCAAGRVRG